MARKSTATKNAEQSPVGQKSAKAAGMSPKDAKKSSQDAILEKDAKKSSHDAMLENTEKFVRPYRSSVPSPVLASQRALTFTDRITLTLIMVVTIFTRLYRLDWPTSVVFDEVHFGKFAQRYIVGKFFFDLHPPLAKMLFAVVAWLGGFKGDFEFDNIGDDYISRGVPYTVMRFFPAICGVLTVALCYCTLRASGCRTAIAAVGTLMLNFENMHVTESRYILLDSPLLFFMAITVYGLKKFQLEVPFTRNWYRFLALTGLGLALTVSSKWVGIYTIGWVGAETLYQLWWIIGDRTVSPKDISRHFLWRALFLIIIPSLFYMAMFAIHFSCVDNYGSGTEFLPRGFSSTLKHNTLPFDIAANVGFGSEVSIRHTGTNGGYLHSHDSMYMTGSKQQQVTLYPHMDINNIWIVENGTADWNTENSTGPVWLKDGSIIRLRHKSTGKRLHSHDHRPPVSSGDHLNEVSGYGFDGFEGDANDNFQVVIVGKESVGTGKNHVQAIRTHFQLRHTTTGCMLFSKDQRLPDWGFEQQEVSCFRNPKLKRSVWYVEENVLPGYDDPERVKYENPGFLRNFIELNKSMWRVNKGLTEPHGWESRPWSWLTLERGINMWGGWKRQVYLTGNRVIMLSVSISLLLYLIWRTVQVLWWQRVAPSHAGLASPFKRSSVNSALVSMTAWGLYESQYSSFMLGWLFHYFPSFLMVRQLFLHHYLSSLYFGILALAHILELIVALLPSRIISYGVVITYLTVIIMWFQAYSPLIYGNKWTQEQCVKRNFAQMDFDCPIFAENAEEYVEMETQIQSSINSARHQYLNPTEVVQTTVSDSTSSENSKQTVYVEQPKVEEPEVKAPIVNEPKTVEPVVEPAVEQAQQQVQSPVPEKIVEQVAQAKAEELHRAEEAKVGEPKAQEAEAPKANDAATQKAKAETDGKLVTAKAGQQSQVAENADLNAQMNAFMKLVGELGDVAEEPQENVEPAQEEPLLFAEQIADLKKRGLFENQEDIDEEELLMDAQALMDLLGSMSELMKPLGTAEAQAQEEK